MATASGKWLKALMALPLFLFAFLLLPTSCSEESDEVEEFPNWEKTNTDYWNTLYSEASQRIAAGDSSWKILKKWSLPDTLHTANTQYIVVHVLNKGTGTGCPLYTDSIRVHYTGKLLPSTSYKDGYEFDTSLTNGATAENSAPAQFLVSQMTDGFATAVQHMHIGDRWQVYVPSTLVTEASEVVAPFLDTRCLCSTSNWCLTTAQEPTCPISRPRSGSSSN